MKNFLKTTIASGAIALGGCHATTTKTSADVYHIVTPETHQVHKASIFDALNEKISFTPQENVLTTEFHMYSHIIGKYDAIHRRAQKYLCQPERKMHCGTPLLGEAIELDRRYHETTSQLIEWLRSEENDKDFQGIELEKNMIENILATLESMHEIYLQLSEVSLDASGERDMVGILAYGGLDALFLEKEDWEARLRELSGGNPDADQNLYPKALSFQEPRE